MSKITSVPAEVIKIGIKYCGGCKPEYDRVQTVNSLRENLKDIIKLVSYNDPNAQGILVVAGCPTACVDLTPFAGRPVWVVTSLKEVEVFVGRMGNSKDEKNLQKLFRWLSKKTLSAEAINYTRYILQFAMMKFRHN
ncbi:MAG: hypothetical protein JW976_07890 [Syntrophaceae bacterium]|nr:hypothetical protein [Syntrophaceae bacterium]